MVDAMLAIWFAAVLVSVAYVAWDLVSRTPEMGVMKWGWSSSPCTPARLAC